MGDEVARTRRLNSTTISPRGGFAVKCASSSFGDPRKNSAPLRAQQPTMPEPAADRVAAAAQLISQARYPIILAGNGVIRAKAWQQLAGFATKLNIPVANTFMAKGVIPFKHPMALGSVGLQAHDYVNTGFDKADVILCIGYDLVEYHPRLWHPTCDRKIIHIDIGRRVNQGRLYQEHR